MVNFYQVVQVAMKIDNFEIMSRERKIKRKFSIGGSSSGKRTKDSQVEPVHCTATKGRWQGPTMTSGSGEGTSTG